MITTDRDEFTGTHLTKETKEMLKIEAKRRGKSLSLLISDIVEKWLETAANEELEPIRSNKRVVSRRILLRAIPGHQHSFDANGNPTCGCRIISEEDVPLPFEGSK